MENAEALDASLAFPADEAGKIDDAASLVHMMKCQYLLRQAPSA